MSVSVLLITPSVGFGELIRQTLEESQGYEVALATSGDQALAYAPPGDLELVIFDADLAEPGPLELWDALRVRHPGARLILVPPESGYEESWVEALAPDGFLSKPFYLPDFLDTVQAVLGPTEAGLPRHPVAEKPGAPAPADHPAHKPPPPPWLQDVERAARHLAQLSLETAAEAALITRAAHIWAYAGELPQPAVQELARAVGDFWAHDRGSDLARFVRLQATGEEYMLYATALAGDLVLSLVFAARTPFSQIRGQAVRLAHALANTPNGEGLQASDQDQPAADAPQADRPLAGHPPQAAAEDFREDPHSGPPDVQAQLHSPGEPDVQVEVQAAARVAPLLEDIPAPVPDELGGEHPLADELGAILSGDVPLQATNQPEEPDPRAEDHGSQARPLENLPREPSQEPSSPRPEPASWEPEYPAGPPALARPPSERTPMDVRTAELAIPAWCQLFYTFVLVPRLPAHRLAGDLGASLREMINQIALAFAWRLQGINVLPDRLAWRVKLSTEISPAAVLDTVREISSERIFAEFPRLRSENPSGDFWAPGHLALTGWREPTDPLVAEFVQATREWQGASGRD